MKKARLADGQVVLSHQFNKAVHAGQLLCADPNCTAHMVFRKESLTHGAAALRSATFVSKSVNDHIANCTAHEESTILARGKESIEQGLKGGKTIVLNLNMALTLTDTYNIAARDLVCVPATLQKRNYVTASANSIEDILDYMKMIEEKAGKAGLDKTVVNYKGKTMPVSDFVINSDAQYRDLLKNLYTKVDGDTQKVEVADFPRLITFRATKRSQGLREGDLFGTPINFPKTKGNKVVLLQVADVRPEFEKTLRGENVHLIAIPRLPLDDAKRVLNELRRKSNWNSFLHLHWNIVGAHQFTPVETPAPDQKSKPKPGQPSLFGM